MSNVVVVEQVKKTFGDVQALKGVSLTIPQGSVFGLIGPNGAGKTTLMSIILGYLDPSAGRVEVLGVSPRQMHTLQGKVAALPQDSDLPPTISVLETLKFFGRLCGLNGPALDSEIDRVLRLVDLSEWRAKKIRQLSHGMKKRVGIAQALLGQPAFVVLDEPTAGLDPKHAHELVQLFRKMAETSTVMISSHNLAELEELCDRAVILVKGDIVRSGTMDEIRKADQQVRLVLSKAPSRMQANWSFDNGTLTVTFRSGAEAREIDEEIARIVQELTAEGASIRSIERGQSLLKTYLDVS